VRHAPRYEIEFQDQHTGRRKLVEVEVTAEEHDAAMESSDPELFLRAYAIKRACLAKPHGNFQPVLPDGVRRVAVN
jgi:hypothetical protein